MHAPSSASISATLLVDPNEIDCKLLQFVLYRADLNRSTCSYQA